MSVSPRNFAQLVFSLTDYVSWPEITAKVGVDLADWQLHSMSGQPDKPAQSRLEKWVNRADLVENIGQKFEQIEGYRSVITAKQPQAQDLFKNYTYVLFSESGFEEVEVLGSLIPEVRVINLKPESPVHTGHIGLSAAILLADLFTLHYRLGYNSDGQIEVDGDELHKIRNFLVESMQKFGQSYDQALGNWQHRPPSEALWKEIAILTGYEIIRRCVESDRVEEIANGQFGPHDCIEAGLRLLSNDRINTPGFLIFVGLALC